MDVQQIGTTVELIRDGGATVFLVLAILGGFKGWYVWRWQYDERIRLASAEVDRVTRERDDWKDIAVRGVGVTEKITTTP